MASTVTAVVLNAAAGDGSAEKVRDRVLELFAAAERPVQVTLAQNGEELRQAIDAAMAQGVAALVGGGGDGTINSVASALVGGATPLGVLPLGTLNHFAKDLGIPLAVDEAIAAILAGHTTPVDIGEVNQKFFLNNSSLGLYPRMVRLRAAHPARGWRKWIVALHALFDVLERNPVISVSIEADGQKLVTRTPIVFVGNGEYTMSGLEAGTRAAISDGKLAIYVVRSGGRPRLMRLAWRMFTGQALRSGELDRTLAESATISVRGSQVSVALDGEVVTLEEPLEYRIRPGALAVLIPQPAPAAS